MKKTLLNSCIILSAVFLISGCSGKKIAPANDVHNSKTATTINSTKQQIPKGIEYKNEKLGFSLTFPESWRGKYRVEENDMGIMVYFEPKEKMKEEGLGFFFGIINKSSKDLHEDTFDTVCDKRYFETQDATYVIGGPSDIGFPDDNPEYTTYKKLRLEIPDIIKTLK